MILEAKSKAIAERIKDKALADLPWTQIFEFLLTAFGMCFPAPATLIEQQRMGPRKQAALGVWIRREFGISGMRNVAAVRQEMLDELASSNEQELTQAWTEANDELTPNFSVI